MHVRSLSRLLVVPVAFAALSCEQATDPPTEVVPRNLEEAHAYMQDHGYTFSDMRRLGMERVLGVDSATYEGFVHDAARALPQESFEALPRSVRRSVRRMLEPSNISLRIAKDCPIPFSLGPTGMPSFAADCDEGGGGGSACGVEALAVTAAVILAGTRIAVAIADPTKITTAAAAGGVLGAAAAYLAFERCLDDSGFNDWAAEVGAEFFGWADSVPTGSFCPMAEGYEPGSNAWKHAMDGCSDTRY